MSYTTFSYSKPTVKANKDGFTATITVTNTGKVASVADIRATATFNFSKAQRWEVHDVLGKPADR